MKRLTVCIALTLASGSVIAAEAQRAASRWPQRRGESHSSASGDLRNGALAPSSASARPNVPTVQKIAGDYQILLHRSIFAMNGLARAESELNARRAAIAGSGAGGPTTRPSAESRLALRGTAIQDGLRYAFLEDTQTHLGRRVHAGDQVANGKVVEITIDGLRFRTAGHETQVLHGNTLEGHPAPAPLASASSSLRDRGWGSRDRRDANNAGPRPEGGAGQDSRQGARAAGETMRAAQPQAVADAGGLDDGPGGGPGIDGPPIDFGPPPDFGPPGGFIPGGGPGGFGPGNFQPGQGGPGGPTQ